MITEDDVRRIVREELRAWDAQVMRNVAGSLGTFAELTGGATREQLPITAKLFDGLKLAGLAAGFDSPEPTVEFEGAPLEGGDDAQQDPDRPIQAREPVRSPMDNIIQGVNRFVELFEPRLWGERGQAVFGAPAQDLLDSPEGRGDLGTHGDQGAVVVDHGSEADSEKVCDPEVFGERATHEASPTQVGASDTPTVGERPVAGDGSAPATGSEGGDR